MDIDKLHELIHILENSNLSELEIEEEGVRVRLSKQTAPLPMPAPVQLVQGLGDGGAGVNDTAEDAAAKAREEEGLVTIDSPMVGTFYSASSPGAPAFIKAGDTVESNQPVCIVEAMKIMNEVVAKLPAMIEKVLVENGEPVEYGQPLFSVRPFFNPL